MNAVLSKPLVKEVANDILNAFITHRVKPHENVEPQKQKTPKAVNIKQFDQLPVLDLELAKKLVCDDEAVIMPII
ncbi:hypothetical protein ACSTH5_23405, partial [Vibrio parahaemolyticus]